jgi:hypothetical protein
LSFGSTAGSALFFQSGGFHGPGEFFVFLVEGGGLGEEGAWALLLLLLLDGRRSRSRSRSRSTGWSERGGWGSGASGWVCLEGREGRRGVIA